MVWWTSELELQPEPTDILIGAGSIWHGSTTLVPHPKKLISAWEVCGYFNYCSFEVFINFFAYKKKFTFHVSARYFNKQSFVNDSIECILPTHRMSFQYCYTRCNFIFGMQTEAAAATQLAKTDEGLQESI